MLVTGAGQIGLAIARRMGYGKKIVIANLTVEGAKGLFPYLTRNN